MVGGGDDTVLVNVPHRSRGTAESSPSDGCRCDPTILPKRLILEQLTRSAAVLDLVLQILLYIWLFADEGVGVVGASLPG